MRRLVVNADDFGTSRGVNLGILEARRCGIVTSASALVHGPAASDIAALRHDGNALDLGLHLDFGEWVYRDGTWASLYEVVPLDDQRAVAKELNRQLDTFRRLRGQYPTHVDSHQHVHRDDPIRDVVIDWARELSLPLRHFTQNIECCGAFYGQTATGDALPEFITTPTLLRILSELPDGLTELTCHPALFVDFESVYGSERVIELKTLCDPQVVAAIESLGIELCSFRDVSVLPSQPVIRAPAPIRERSLL
jgi:predicted glycoside hydrolase/deacetylase ChbG (UPF0249 family)